MASRLVSALSGSHFDPFPSPGGSLSQLPGFTLTVPQSVSVQEGLCVLVPCTSAYPASYDTKNSWSRLYRYWYKDPANEDSDPPVASSDSNRGVSQETQGRFQLAKNPAHGDCSLQISDARRTDMGRYFLRVKKGNFKYSYHFNSDGTDAKLTISVPGTLLAGEPVTLTCTAPGRCSGPPPQVTWTGPFSDTARDVSAQLANGTWAHSSALSFTPSPGDHGKELVCTVTYRPPWGPSTHRTALHAGPLCWDPHAWAALPCPPAPPPTQSCAGIPTPALLTPNSALCWAPHPPPRTFSQFSSRPLPSTPCSPFCLGIFTASCPPWLRLPSLPPTCPAPRSLLCCDPPPHSTPLIGISPHTSHPSSS
uniref:Ig-like domain-containing protein n=1 Tax=Chelonoidis abingdonii TaxID=106734 RepID=A0A8C0FW18_CHEAB